MADLRQLLRDSIELPSKVEAERRAAAPVTILARCPKPVDGLRPFQVAARELLATLPEGRFNILCTAPTGAGKSLVIRFAAEACARAGSVLCVGVPLVALAEQMFEGLRSAPELQDRVWLLTGPHRERQGERPAVAVCTYEALACVCCDASSELLRATLVVAIDELHEISDPERGVAIEEILDACARFSIRIVALSGTVPNSRQVAEYLSAYNGFDCHILTMARRPVPLELFFFDLDDKERRFRPLPELDTRPTRPARRPDPADCLGRCSRRELLDLLRDLESWAFPLLLVGYSCDALTSLAFGIESAGFDFLHCRADRSRATVAFDEMAASLPEEDRCLVAPLRSLAARGIFVHHGRMLAPYLRLAGRMAEQGLARLTCTTSTLRAGLNFPTRGILHTQLMTPTRDEDGVIRHQLIDKAAFSQMNGRAGRPGYDTVGYVVVVGRGEDGLQAAMDLAAAPLPPVRCAGAHGVGDVLRAKVQARCTSLTRSVFADAKLRWQQLLLARSEELALRALEAAAVTGPRRAAVCAAAPAVARLLTASPQAAEATAEAGEPLWLWRDGERGELAVGPEARSRPAAPLRRPRRQQRPRALPLSMLLEATQLREQAAALRALLPAGEGELLALAVAANAELDRAAVASVESECIATEARLRAEGLLLDAAGGLTPVGRAVAHVRCCRSPALVARYLTDWSDLEAGAVVELFAMLIGETRRTGSFEDSAFPFKLDAEVQAAVRQALPEASSAFFVASASRWGNGCALSDLLDFGPGAFAKLVVRVHDLMVETLRAAEVLGTDAPEQLREAMRRLCRGLPFQSRF